VGRWLLGRSWGRFANSDRRGRDGAAHWRHLKPGSARLLAEGAVIVWRFGSGSGDAVRVLGVALPPLRRPLTAISTCWLPRQKQTSRSRQSSTGIRRIPSSHLSGVWLDLVAATKRSAAVVNMPFKTAAAALPSVELPAVVRLAAAHLLEAARR